VDDQESMSKLSIVTCFQGSADEIVDVFVASEGIPTSGLGVEHVVIFVGISFHFRFGENPLRLELGDLGACVGVSLPHV
jgi:hypothetical protein